MRRWWMSWWGCTYLLMGMLLSSCGDPVEKAIEGLVAGGDAAEQARMELNLAKGAAIEPLIDAFANTDYPPSARVDMSEIEMPAARYSDEGAQVGCLAVEVGGLFEGAGQAQ